MIKAWTVISTACALTWGCNVFDASLERRLDGVQPARDAGDDAGVVDGSVDAGQPPLGDGAVPPFMIANACEAGRLPRVSGSLDPLSIPVLGLTSNVRESGECEVAPSVLGGGDGFFEIQALAGERWHFHMDAAEGQNLSVLASRGCDLRECVASADVCGSGESEHFTFIPETAGSYVVVVEGIDTSKDQVLTLLAVNPKCGDGVKEHSEVCDDGNPMSGDGCDSFCRAELTADLVNEVEPNDDSYGANVLLGLPTKNKPVTVQGKIAGGACQPDYYMLSLLEPRELSARVLTAAGRPCSDAPELQLSLIRADGEALRESERVARSVTKNACPAIEGEILPPGSYFLRLHQLVPAPQFDYRLELTLAPVPP